MEGLPNCRDFYSRSGKYKERIRMALTPRIPKGKFTPESPLRPIKRPGTPIEKKV